MAALLACLTPACGGAAQPKTPTSTGGGTCEPVGEILRIMHREQAVYGTRPCSDGHGIYDLDGDGTGEYVVACDRGERNYRFTVFLEPKPNCMRLLAQLEGLAIAPVAGSSGTFPDLEARRADDAPPDRYRYDPAVGRYAPATP